MLAPFQFGQFVTLEGLRAHPDLIEYLNSLQASVLTAFTGEQANSLNAGAFEWSFGNNGDIPGDQGIPFPFQRKLVAVSSSLLSGTATINICKDGTAVHTHDAGSSSTPNNTWEVLTTPIAFEQGSVLNFQTNTASGTASPNTVTAWFGV